MYPPYKHAHTYTSYCAPTYHGGCFSSLLWSKFTINIKFTHTNMHDANAWEILNVKKSHQWSWLRPPNMADYNDVIEVQLCNRVRLRSTVHVCVCLCVRQVLFPSIHFISVFPSTSQCGPYFMYYILEQNHAHFCLSHIHHHHNRCMRARNEIYLEHVRAQQCHSFEDRQTV